MLKQEQKILILLTLFVLVAFGFRYWRFMDYKAKSELYLQDRDSLFYGLKEKADSIYNATVQNSIATRDKKVIFSRKSSAKVVSKININKVSLSEIQKIPGIGPVLAARLIDHRNINGSFKSIDELLDVKGIGSKKLEKIRGWIKIE